MKTKNKISLITLTCNNLEKATKPFLNYLYKAQTEFELIIVDNGSTDGTVEFLNEFQKTHDNVKIIYNSENLGFSKGCNQGIKVTKGDIIGLLNNDILFSSDWIKYIVDFIEKEDNVGFVSPQCIEGFCNSKHKFEKKTKKISNETISELYIKPNFACVFTKKSVFDKIGLFDENFTPAYFEDDDMIWRATFAGFKNFVLQNIYFYHLGSVTGSTLPNLSDIFERNKKYFFQKYSDKPFVESYWRLSGEYISFRNRILKKRKRNFLLRLLLRNL
jgi:GT2 family glycosyltransferase